MQTAIPFALHLTPGTLAANQEFSDTTPKPKAKRGPKPKVTPNPRAHLIRMALMNSLSFIDDAVMAGLYIAVGDSNGKLNVRPRHLRKVICLNVISTADILPRFINNHGEPISERTAQYLAAAARVALGGIERHLRQHPALVSRLQAQWDRAKGDDDGWCDLDSVQADYSFSQWEWHQYNVA